jgi:uncharacterized membrane protein
MQVRQTLFEITHGIVSILFLAVGIVTLYYWGQHWLTGPSAETMGQAGAATVILLVLLVPVVVMERRKNDTEG